MEAKAREELTDAFATLKREEAQALVVVDDRVLNGNAPQIAELALESGVPTIGERAHVTAGALLAYGVDLRQFWFRSATFVDKDLERRETSRPAHPTSDSVRIHHQLENRQSAGS